MDANKDEAERCISMAKSRLASGQPDMAKKWLKKARHLYPSVNISGLESLLRSSRSPSRERVIPNGRKAVAPDRASSDSDGPSPAFTKAQADAVRKVLACKDYYDLLGVSKESTEDDIRKAYKSLALKFHPDKNRAPGATEAFKKIGTALGVLTDPEKRRRYDQYGTEQEEVPRITRVYRRGEPFFQYDTDVFNMFFNTGFPFSQVYAGHRPARSRESERENNYFIYVQLVPLVLIFLLSFFSNLLVPDPYYSLVRTSKYPIERITQQHQVPFYVKTTFDKDFLGHTGQLENQVETEFATNLRTQCFRDREYKRGLMNRARYYGDQESYDRASRIQLAACDQLERIFGG